jgi:hypothetical protein
VYAVQDTDGDFVADKKWILDSGLNMPNGVAFKDGDLYVAEVSRILKYEDMSLNWIILASRLWCMINFQPKRTMVGSILHLARW